MSEDRSIIIGTKIRQQDFDKGIAEIDKKLQKLEEKARQPIEIGGVQVTGDWNLTEKEQNYYDRLSHTMEELQQKRVQQLVQEGYIDQEIANQVEDVNDLLDTYDNVNEEVQKITEELNEMIAEYKELTEGDVLFESDLEKAKELKEEIIETIQTLEEMTGDKIYFKGFTDLPDIAKKANKEVNNVGKGIKGVIKNVTRWGLAVFGIRSAYMFIRQSMSVLSQENEQMATDLEYIRYALASTLQPIIEYIIKLVFQLLLLLGNIIKRLTGRNIFENANKGLGKANKQAKDLKKQLAGFDEMNILSDDNNKDNVISPSIDLSKLGKGDTGVIYKWLKKVKAMFDLTFQKIKENVTKVLRDLGFSEEFIFGWELTIDGIKQGIDGLLEFIEGILEIIVGLLAGDTEQVKEGFKKLIKGIVDLVIGTVKTLTGIFAQGVAIIYNSVIKPIQEGIKVLVTFIWNLIKDLWNGTRNLLGTIGNWIYSNVISPVANFFKGLWQGIKDGFSSAINFIKSIFNSVVNFFKGIISSIVNLFQNIGTRVGDVIGGAFKAVVNGVLSAIESILNFPIRTINSLIKTINKIPGINLGTLSTFNLPRLAKGGIINMPGRGVPIGGTAIGGERAPEGVIPLTDSQQMELLGQSIGKYITINATIPVYAYNRQVDRQIRTIRAEDDFAFNR